MAMTNQKQIKVLYLLQGAGFAGAESYALSLIGELSKYKDVKCFAATCYSGPLVNYLVRKNVETFLLHGKNNLKSIISVIVFVKKAKIDIIHCVDIKSSLVGGIASLFLRGIKTITTVHGLPEFYPKIFRQIVYSISLVIYYGLLRYIFDAKICVSNDLRTRITHIIGTKCTVVIHNGIDIAPLKASSESSTTKATFTIGTVGRLEKVKGHNDLISAAQMILSERDDIVFDIIGDGPLEESLKKTVYNLGLSNKIRFLGFRPDARKLIDKFDIFVLPSLHEGIPYVLLEAMAAGKPVVCTCVGGVPEVVTHNLDGILVSPKDPIGLCNALKDLLAKRDFMEMLGKNARDTIQKRFSSTLMSERTYSLYLDLMAC